MIDELIRSFRYLIRHTWLNTVETVEITLTIKPLRNVLDLNGNRTESELAQYIFDTHEQTQY